MNVLVGYTLYDGEIRVKKVSNLMFIFPAGEEELLCDYLSDELENYLDPHLKFEILSQEEWDENNVEYFEY